MAAKLNALPVPGSRCRKPAQALRPGPSHHQQAVAIDEAQRAAGAWPQYYIGARPTVSVYRLTCTRANAARSPARAPVNHDLDRGNKTGRVHWKGSSAGTHWYPRAQTWLDHHRRWRMHDRCLIIEGEYDDALNSFYHVGWTGSQPWAPIAAGAGDQPVGNQPQSVRRRRVAGWALPFSLTVFTPLYNAAVRSCGARRSRVAGVPAR